MTRIVVIHEGQDKNCCCHEQPRRDAGCRWEVNRVSVGSGRVAVDGDWEERGRSVKGEAEKGRKRKVQLTTPTTGIRISSHLNFCMERKGPNHYRFQDLSESQISQLECRPVSRKVQS